MFNTESPVTSLRSSHSLSPDTDTHHNGIKLHKKCSVNASSSFSTTISHSQNMSQRVNVNQNLSQNVTPANSCSRIILNCSANFSSLRIEDPKRVDDDATDAHMKLLVNSIPAFSRHFHIINKLGEGTFSKVYRIRSNRDSNKEYALKYLIPTIRPSRSATEMRYLRDFAGKSNIIPILGGFMAKGHIAFVMPIFPHERFTDYLQYLSVDEVKDYMKNLLIALKEVHKHHIIHRDVKPANFLYDRINGKYALVDFGLAQSEKELMRWNVNSMIDQHKDDVKKSAKQKSSKSTNFNAVVLKDCTFNNGNKPIVQSESKWQIRKRTIKEVDYDTPKQIKSVKRIRIDNDHRSSVFNTPNTPNGFKTPPKAVNIDIDKQKLDNGQMVMNTPIKSPLIIIPETPPKTMFKPKNLMSNENLKVSQINETPKVRKKKLRKVRPKDRHRHAKCDCFGNGNICVVCRSKSDLIAPRAGTPGFRAPEVLLKYVNQTSVIDIWSAGVIFACLLSGRYPFFRNIDDITALSEIITVLGAKRVQRAANELGKTLIVSNNCKPMDLQLLCSRLRGDDQFKVPLTAYDLLDKMLDPNPKTRISASVALKHSFFN